MQLSPEGAVTPKNMYDSVAKVSNQLEMYATRHRRCRNSNEFTALIEFLERSTGVGF